MNIIAKNALVTNVYGIQEVLGNDKQATFW